MSPSVLLPLYVYPSAGAWDPVYEMAILYPHVHFTAIVNPHNGPGEGAMPNNDYTQAIKTLNSMRNVRAIGYVATTWCRKGLQTVLDEIAQYAGWGTADPALAMSGIFFDETPTGYCLENASYLQTIFRAVRLHRGLKNGFVVHNPGALPEAPYFAGPYFQEPADLTVVFEDSHANWAARAGALIEATRTYDPERLAVLLHSVPNLTTDVVKQTLRQLLRVGTTGLLTRSGNYTAFDSPYGTFIDCWAHSSQ